MACIQNSQVWKTLITNYDKNEKFGFQKLFAKVGQVHFKVGQVKWLAPLVLGQVLKKSICLPLIFQVN